MRDRPVRAVLASVLLVVCVVGDSRAQSAAPKRSQATAAPNRPADWTEKDPLPLLVATQIQPVAESQIFKINDLYIEFLLEEKPKAAGRLFASRDEAVASARKWTVAHFGGAPADTPLKLKGVDLEPGEAAKPFNDREADHSVEFRQFYRGIPTSSRVVFVATGQTPTRVIVELRRFKPVPDSAKPVVSREAAIKAWRDIFAKKAAPEELAAFDKAFETRKPELRYEWSPLANRGLDDRAVFAPTWVLDAERSGLYMVDGHSGKAWYND